MEKVIYNPNDWKDRTLSQQGSIVHALSMNNIEKGITDVAKAVNELIDCPYIEGPQGPKGDKGDTGEQGPMGEQGYSAYELAVIQGFNGSLDDWLASIKPNVTDIEGFVNDQIKKVENLKIVDTIDDLDDDSPDGAIRYIRDAGVYYSKKNGEWEIFQSGSGGGGGGGSVIGTLTSTLDQKTVSISVGEQIVVDLFFSTPNVGAGNLHVLSNGTEILTQSVTMGANKVSLTLAKGTYKLELYVIDRGGVYTNSVVVNVQCGGLDITTTFNHEKDYTVGAFINFPYKIDTVSTKPITTYFIIGNNKYETTSQKGHNTYRFPDLGAGTHKVEVYSVSGEYESNRIRFTLVLLNSGSLYVSSLFDKSEAEEGDQLLIDYRVSMKDVKEFIVEYLVDGEHYKDGKAFNGANTFPISDLKVGPRTITIKVTTKDKKHTAQIDIKINIKESSYELQPPVKDGLMAWFDAYGLSNQDSEKEIWKDKSGNGYVGKLYNFNYSSNGWINNGLKMNGSAYAMLNVQPFLNNAENGITIDVEFQTEDIGNENANVLDCTTRFSSGVGCHINTNEAIIKSNSNTVKPQFAQNEKTRVTYVIDRENKLTKVYINAVLCEVAFLTDMGSGNNEILEDFEHSEYIYLNSKKGESDFGDCIVYNVRVYDRALTSEDVLKNFISDIKDKELQKKKYDFNYNNTIPTMYFYGDDSAMSKENKVPLRIRYISTDDEKYGESFDLENCLVQWQGTSSLQYVVKNYKIRLQTAEGKKFKRPLRKGMIPESKFTLKADYMESSHANNTGAAKIVNRYLYDTPLPPQVDNKDVVSAIDGFPIKLYINEKLIGVFNFNLDKGCEDSFGLDKELFPKCVSYEISANTDSTAGAFNKWTPETGKTELEYLQKDFELRYPDEKDDPEYGYLTDLKRVVNWVSDADEKKFKSEFEDYFNKEYTLKYYLFVLVFGMVDNLGKNLMLNSWDGNIWYPCFYDLDTCLALDNSGYVKFDVDIEMTAGVYNTSGSKLWTKVANVFEDEITELYKKMRGGLFKEANLLKVLIDEQIDQIPEMLYNLDSQQKYLNFGKSYIHMLHGSRREHMRKWIRERLLYLDSKFGYEENISESITVRANKEGDVHFDIKTYSPIYIKVRWRNGEEVLQKVGRNETVRFSYELPTATDQEIFIYAANQLKEIGDISHMTPTSLSLSSASRLTKLECRNNDKLQALGMGGVVNGVSYNLKNLQLLDLSGCSKLGTASGNNGLDVTYCDNLKILKIEGTALQNVMFNPKGGNLEEIYMSNSISTLHLANQYSLRKVIFPWYKDARMTHRMVYENGSNVSNISITNCVNLVQLGIDSSILDYSSLLNYREVAIDSQDDFEITKADYELAYTMSVFGKLENISIDNALLNYKYCSFTCSPSLKSVTFNSMPKLKGIILTGNRTYTQNTAESYTEYNFEKTSQFDKLSVIGCPEFDTLIIQKPTRWFGLNHAYKFKDNFTWDLSKVPLKKFICNIALQNLNKLILPDSIEEFSHSNTVLSKSGNNNPDGSSSKYSITDSPLETIVVHGHYTEGFKGIDFANKKMKNVNLNGLTQKVDMIQNIDCDAIDIVPRMVAESSDTKLQKLNNIKINLNNYKINSFYGAFSQVDLSKVTITADSLSVEEDADYSFMFNKAINASWEKLKWIKNLPKGQMYKTFNGCDIDKLEVGNMIGPTTVDLSDCFSSMSGVVEIDIEGADTSNVTTMMRAFSQSTKLVTVKLRDCVFDNVIDFSRAFSGDTSIEQILGVEDIVHVNCNKLDAIFYNTPNLKFKFPNGKPNWKFGKNVTLVNFMLNCGGVLEIHDSEDYILDLSACGDTITERLRESFYKSGFTKIILNGLDLTVSEDNASIFGACPNLRELVLARPIKWGPDMHLFAPRCPKLTTVDISGVDMSMVNKTADFFHESKNLTSLKFGKGLTRSIDFSKNTKLTDTSIISIIDNIGTAKPNAILNLGPENLEKISEAQQKKATDKKWSLA